MLPPGVEQEKCTGHVDHPHALDLQFSSTLVTFVQTQDCDGADDFLVAMPVRAYLEMYLDCRPEEMAALVPGDVGDESADGRKQSGNQ